MTANISEIADLLNDARQRADSLRAGMLVYLIQSAIDEATDLSNADATAADPDSIDDSPTRTTEVSGCLK